MTDEDKARDYADKVTKALTPALQIMAQALKVDGLQINFNLVVMPDMPPRIDNLSVTKTTKLFG